jgi:hypothetical protein
VVCRYNFKMHRRQLNLTVDVLARMTRLVTGSSASPCLSLSKYLGCGRSSSKKIGTLDGRR